MAKIGRDVHAFEPECRNFEILQKNLALNDIKNVSVYDFAVADKSGTTTLHLCESNRGMHRIYPSKWCNGGTLEIETVRVDDVVKQADFIKMDIEGAEFGA